MPDHIAILVGGSDLFSGLRGISAGTKIIQQQVEDCFDEVVAVNYNYFLNFGSSVRRLITYVHQFPVPPVITLYGYSKGGDVVLQLARHLKDQAIIPLLITIDIANGPWSHKINRVVPANVRRNINVYQTTPNFPLRSHGMPAIAEGADVIVENINLTNQYMNGLTVSHGNIENIMVKQVVGWMMTASSKKANGILKNRPHRYEAP
jgi:hypothetical protein